MAELLVRITNKATGIVGAEMAGDVVAVCPDGWGWTTAETTNPEWRVIKLPGIDPASLADYQAAQFDVAGRVMFARAVGIDMTSPIGEWLVLADQVADLSAESVLDILESTVVREEGAVL